MPSVRHHIITGDPILFAPERAGRPNAFGNDAGEPCPFCPGNEAMTPPEIERIGDPWRIRVFPNKYPSVEGHEVIVESADHRAAPAGISHMTEVIGTYMRRYDAHREAAFVAVFTNHGRRAGASIDHLHSQVMPLPFVPLRVEREIDAFAQSGDDCPLCAAIEQHRKSGLVIDENGGFVRLAPSGSSHAYEQWVVPLRHQPEITTLQGDEVAELGIAVQQAAASAERISSAHNMILMSFRNAPAAHFYLMMIPRLSALAGFELGTGTFIDIIDPAAAVRALR